MKLPFASILFTILVAIVSAKEETVEAGGGLRGLRASCSRTCYLPTQSGNCYGAIPKWSFNSRTGRCERFTYGGCGGNGNRFDSQAQCNNRCGGCSRRPRPTPGPKPRPPAPQPTRPAPRPTPSPVNCQKCRQPVQPGNCYGNFPKWAYNPRTKTCGRFTYGGCGGNGNNFSSQAQCSSSCRGC